MKKPPVFWTEEDSLVLEEQAAKMSSFAIIRAIAKELPKIERAIIQTFNETGKLPTWLDGKELDYVATTIAQKATKAKPCREVAGTRTSLTKADEAAILALQAEKRWVTSEGWVDSDGVYHEGGRRQIAAHSNADIATRLGLPHDKVRRFIQGYHTGKQPREWVTDEAGRSQRLDEDA